MAKKNNKSLVDQLRERKMALAKEANKVGAMKRTRNFGGQRITLPRMSWEKEDEAQ